MVTSPTIESGETTGERRPLVTANAISRGTEISLTNALVGGAIGQTVSVSRGVIRHGYAGQSLEVRQAVAGVVATAGQTSVQQAGARAVLSAGSVTMTQAGSGLAVGRSIRIERQGVVVFGIAPRIDVHEGGRVIFGPKASLALIGGLGALLAAATMMRRRGDGPA
ncbi:MAG TPA: hypothetical protein VI277_08165 [Candidatus Limnocylindria bacterium]